MATDAVEPGGTPVLPLRPLTVGELLDASIGLLRRCGWSIVLAGLVLAALQQTMATALGLLLPSGPGPVNPRWLFWLACWLGTEIGIITLLAAPASVAAAATLVGSPVPRGFALLRAPGRRWAGVLVTAVLVGLLAWIGGLACGVPWVAVYGLVGLAVPVQIVDGVPPAQAVQRPLRLLFAGAGRPAGIRLLAYLAWLALRLAVGLAGGYLVSGLDLSPVPDLLLGALPWVAVDAVAYPALACLDACLHLENRMRTEGLDLALGRAPAGRAATVLGAVP